MMATQREKRGSGMTEREIVSVDADDHSAAIELLKRAAPSHAYLEPLERFALKILKEVGITSPRNSGWLEVVESQGYAEDSPEGYAARILGQIRCIRAVLKAGDAAVASQFGFELGLLAKEAAMKFEFEPTWETGLKIKLAAQRGGQSKRGQTAERDLEMAEEFERRRPTSGLSDTALKAAIGRDHNLTRSPAVAAVNRGRKILSR